MGDILCLSLSWLCADNLLFFFQIYPFHLHWTIHQHYLKQHSQSMNKIMTIVWQQCCHLYFLHDYFYHPHHFFLSSNKNSRHNYQITRSVSHHIIHGFAEARVTRCWTVFSSKSCPKSYLIVNSFSLLFEPFIFGKQPINRTLNCRTSEQFFIRVFFWMHITMNVVHHPC